MKSKLIRMSHKIGAMHSKRIHAPVTNLDAIDSAIRIMALVITNNACLRFQLHMTPILENMKTLNKFLRSFSWSVKSISNAINRGDAIKARLNSLNFSA